MPAPLKNVVLPRWFSCWEPYSAHTFVTPTILLLPNASERASLDLCPIPLYGHYPIMFDLREDSWEKTEPIALSLRLPTFSNRFAGFSGHINGTSAMGATQHSAEHAFHISSSASIIILRIRCIQKESNDDNNFSYRWGPVLVVHRSSLAALYDKYTGTATTTLEWEEWGPTATRWLPASAVGESAAQVVGHRAIVPLRASKAGSTSYDITVLDFNPLQVRKPETSRPRQNISVCDSLTVLQDPAFKDPVRSGLPYMTSVHSLTIPEVAEYPTLLVDEERLVEIAAREDAYSEVRFRLPDYWFRFLSLHESDHCLLGRISLAEKDFDRN
ncbi:hypothetical protein H0H87_006869 [Tephrocybe sp. NHM501043]|nr:hypothetical protein H0H87_006869 [Tephrocybe sp. NHM501043]